MADSNASPGKDPRLGPRARYFEDFQVGEVFLTPGRTVTEADLVNFAGLSGDFNSIHTDAEFAAQTPFGQRIAHGPLGLAFLVGLVGRLGLTEGTAIAMLGIEWSFRRPLFIGDTVHARVLIEQLKETSKPDRGVVVRQLELLNQHGEVIQAGTMPVMVMRRPS